MEVVVVTPRTVKDVVTSTSSHGSIRQAYLIRKAIKGRQRSSEVIRGHQRSSGVIRGHRRVDSAGVPFVRLLAKRVPLWRRTHSSEMAQARAEVEREEFTRELRRHEERTAGIGHVAYRDPEAVQRAGGEDAVEAHLRLVDGRRDARGGEHGGDVDASCVMLILARARAVVDADWEALEHQGARVHRGQLRDAS